MRLSALVVHKSWNSVDRLQLTKRSAGAVFAQLPHSNGVLEVVLKANPVGRLSGQVEFRSKDAAGNMAQHLLMNMHAAGIDVFEKQSDGREVAADSSEAMAAHLAMRTLVTRLVFPENLSRPIRTRFSKLLERVR